MIFGEHGGHEIAVAFALQLFLHCIIVLHFCFVVALKFLLHLRPLKISGRREGAWV